MSPRGERYIEGLIEELKERGGFSGSEIERLTKQGEDAFGERRFGDVRQIAGELEEKEESSDVLDKAGQEFTDALESMGLGHLDIPLETLSERLLPKPQEPGQRKADVYVDEARAEVLNSLLEHDGKGKYLFGTNKQIGLRILQQKHHDDEEMVVKAAGRVSRFKYGFKKSLKDAAMESGLRTVGEIAQWHMEVSGVKMSDRLKTFYQRLQSDDRYSDLELQEFNQQVLSSRAREPESGHKGKAKGKKAVGRSGVERLMPPGHRPVEIRDDPHVEYQVTQGLRREETCRAISTELLSGQPVHEVVGLPDYETLFQMLGESCMKAKARFEVEKPAESIFETARRKVVYAVRGMNSSRRAGWSCLKKGPVGVRLLYEIIGQSDRSASSEDELIGLVFPKRTVTVDRRYTVLENSALQLGDNKEE